jgi:DNA-directed RNA polymerase subunit E'/Rpb7
MSLVSRKNSRIGTGTGTGTGTETGIGVGLSRRVKRSGSGGAGARGNMSLYIKNIITKKLSIPIKYVGANIKQVLEDILKKEFEGKCCIDGYVKKGSSKIITYSCGNIYGNIALFTIVFEYLVCNPPNGMRISCVVNNITNAGIMGVANNTDISPVNIFIARDHHYNIPYFSQLKNEDVVMVRVIGQRFELNDSAVFIIAELEEILERGGIEGRVDDQELLVSNSKKNMENLKKVSGAEGEGEGEEEEEEPETGSKAGPAKSPLSVIAEESQGMMKSLFSSKKSSEEEQEQDEQEEQEEQEELSGGEEEEQEQEQEQ